MFVHYSTVLGLWKTTGTVTTRRFSRGRQERQRLKRRRLVVEDGLGPSLTEIKRPFTIQCRSNLLKKFSADSEGTMAEEDLDWTLQDILPGRHKRGLPCELICRLFHCIHRDCGRKEPAFVFLFDGNKEAQS